MYRLRYSTFCAVLSWLLVVGYSLKNSDFGLPYVYVCLIFVKIIIVRKLFSLDDYGDKLKDIFHISLYLSVCLAVVVTLNYELVNGYGLRTNGNEGGYDDYNFYIVGLNISQKIIQFNFTFTEELSQFTHNGYPLLLGLVFTLAKVLGTESTLVPRLFNCLAGAFLVSTVAFTSEFLFNRKIAIRAASLVAFFPLFWFYSANIVRDIWVALCVCLLVWQFLKISIADTKLERRFTLFNIFAVSLCLYFLRNDSFIVILCAILVSKLLFPVFEGEGERTEFLKILVLFAGVLLLTSVFEVGQPINQIIGKSDRYEVLAEAGASEDSLAMRLIFSQPALIREPLKFSFTLFGPSLKFEYYVDSVEIVGAVWWTLISSLLVVGIWKNRDSSRIKYLGVIIFILILAVSMVAGNPRHKLQFYPLSMIVISYQLTYYPVISQVIIKVWLQVFVLLIFLYAFLKYL